MLWITGAKGLVGKALCKAALHCVATGREVDIADQAMCRKFVKKNGVTRIVNCAAFSQVDPAETNREEAFRSNALGPEVLGRVAKEMGIQLLHLSTDYIFGGQGRVPLKETDAAEPCNVYGWTKLEGEKRLMAVCPEACILRTSWVFGDGGKNFVAKLVELLHTKKELRLVDDQIGRPTYAPDLARAILQMLGKSGIYHFANAGPTNKYEFALAVQEKLQRPVSIVPVKSSEFISPAKRPLYSALDTTKIEQHLPIRHWRECLAEYLCEF